MKARADGHVSVAKEHDAGGAAIRRRSQADRGTAVDVGGRIMNSGAGSKYQRNAGPGQCSAAVYAQAALVEVIHSGIQGNIGPAVQAHTSAIYAWVDGLGL